MTKRARTAVGAAILTWLGVVATDCSDSDEQPFPLDAIEAGSLDARVADVRSTDSSATPDVVVGKDGSVQEAAADTSAPDANQVPDGAEDADGGDASDGAADAIDDSLTLPDASDDAADASDAIGVDAAKWVYVKVDDCPGQDRIAYSTGTDVPVEADCDLANAGTVAVCWDQTTHTNSLVPGSQPGCTYKSATLANCTGGGHPGAMYVCTP